MDATTQPFPADPPHDCDRCPRLVEYRAANAVAFAKYGARFLIRGGAQEEVEGHTKPRTVVIEFDSVETARACYFSPEYQAAKALRDPVSTGDVVIIEGYEG